MGFKRHAAGRLAILWLVCQLSIAALSPVALCAQIPIRASACTCAHNDGQACPMHQSTEGKTRTGCSCSSTTDVPTAILGALLGTIAVLPSPSATIATSLTGELSWPALSLLIDRLVVPDAPPPRS
jgi:hypothetical protein